MYDMHYDLLTAIYMAKLDNNLEGIKKWISYYNKDNVIGLIANMCFMTEDEMKLEYHPNYYNKEVSPLNMFKTSIDLVNEFIDKDVDILFGIEGFDYINSVADLDILYNLGLRSIIPVWNETNKYGSGIRGNGGLTLEGKKLIHKAISLGIGIDLSHANEKTFDDIISIIKEYKKIGIDPMVYASHSNSKALCKRLRNLTDDQLRKLKEVDGYVGVMSNRNFVTYDSVENDIDINLIREDYVKHLIYIGNIIGFDHLLVSTDDMKFSKGDEVYQTLPIYDYRKISKELREDLGKYFNNDEIENIMVNNASKLFKKLKGGYYERKSRNIM